MYFPSIDVDVPQYRVVLRQGYRQRGARLAKINQRAAIGFADAISVLFPQIADMNDALPGYNPLRHRSRTVIRRVLLTVFDISGRNTSLGRCLETFTVIDSELAERRSAQPHCLFEHRVEDRREVAGRGIDDL